MQAGCNCLKVVALHGGALAVPLVSAWLEQVSAVNRPARGKRLAIAHLSFAGGANLLVQCSGSGPLSPRRGCTSYISLVLPRQTGRQFSSECCRTGSASLISQLSVACLALPVACHLGDKSTRPRLSAAAAVLHCWSQVP